MSPEWGMVSVSTVGISHPKKVSHESLGLVVSPAAA
jgi:hypothetical protein